MATPGDRAIFRHVTVLAAREDIKKHREAQRGNFLPETDWAMTGYGRIVAPISTCIGRLLILELSLADRMVHSAGIMTRPDEQLLLPRRSLNFATGNLDTTRAG